MKTLLIVKNEWHGEEACPNVMGNSCLIIMKRLQQVSRV